MFLLLVNNSLLRIENLLITFSNELQKKFSVKSNPGSTSSLTKSLSEEEIIKLLSSKEFFLLAKNLSRKFICKL